MTSCRAPGARGYPPLVASCGTNWTRRHLRPERLRPWRGQPCMECPVWHRGRIAPGPVLSELDIVMLPCKVTLKCLPEIGEIYKDNASKSFNTSDTNGSAGRLPHDSSRITRTSLKVYTCLHPLTKKITYHKITILSGIHQYPLKHVPSNHVVFSCGKGTSSGGSTESRNPGGRLM